MQLQPYCLVEFGRHGQKKRLERFIETHPNRGQHFFILAEGKRAMPHLIRKVELDHSFEHGQARIVEDDYITSSLREQNSLGEQEKNRVDAAWRVIRHLTAEEHILDESSRGELIKWAVAKDPAVAFSPKSFNAFERLVKKLMDPNPNAAFYGISMFLAGSMDPQAKTLILDTSLPQEERRKALAAELNRIIQGPSIYGKSGVSGIALAEATQGMREQAEITQVIMSLEPDQQKAAYKISVFLAGNMKPAAKQLVLDSSVDLEERKWTLEQEIDRMSKELEEDAIGDAAANSKNGSANATAALTKFNRLLIEENYYLEIAKCDPGFSRGTIYNYLRKFWQRGGTKAALQPDYSSGSPDKRKKRRKLAKDQDILKKNGFKKWGAKGKKKQGRGINVTKADQQIFRKVIREHFHGQRNKIHFTRLHELMWDQYYSVTGTGPDGQTVTKRLSQDQVPTIYQLRYFYENNYSLTRRTELREGKLVMEKKFRAIPGDQTLRFQGPGFEYQIDSTIADIHLVDETRQYLVGRPTLYLVVDTFSVMITGVHITLENAQFSEATEAVWNAFDDKVSYCSALDIKINQQDWPATGLPHAILADRGEILGKQFDEVVSALSIRIGNTPPYRADLKGLVERKFKTLNDLQIRWLRGAVPKSDYDPRKNDYRKEAKLTLHDFTRAIVLRILQVNQTPMKHHHLRGALEKAGVAPVPLDVWRWGMKNSTASLRAAAPNYVRCALLPSGTGVVTKKGIKFGGLLYLPKDPATLNRILSEARIRHVWNEPIRFHRYSVKRIYLLGKTYGDLQVCELADSYRHHSLLSWREWEAVKSASGSDSTSESESQRRGQANRQVAKIEEEAAGKTSEECDGAPLNVKRVAETRAADKDQHGKAHAIKTAASIDPNTASAPSDATVRTEPTEPEKAIHKANKNFFAATEETKEPVSIGK
jgi:hypothetical protein